MATLFWVWTFKILLQTPTQQPLGASPIFNGQNNPTIIATYLATETTACDVTLDEKSYKCS